MIIGKNNGKETTSHMEEKTSWAPHPEFQDLRLPHKAWMDDGQQTDVQDCAYRSQPAQTGNDCTPTCPNCEAERQDTDLWSWNVPKHAYRKDMTRSTATQTSTRQGWKIRTWWCSQSTLLPLLFYPEFLNHTCMHWSMIEHSIGIYMNLCRRCFWSILTGRFPMVVLIA